MTLRPWLALLLLAAPAGAEAPRTEADAPRIALAELEASLAAGKLVLLDVRSADAYAAGHIPGAQSVPLADLSQHADELRAAKKPIVAYCG